MSQSAICTYRRHRRVNLPNQRPLDVQSAPTAQFTMLFDATTTTSWVTMPGRRRISQIALRPKLFNTVDASSRPTP
ncbi:Conserved protein of unknown function [Mycobacterium canettii CIPT 140070017]|nr:Conserved protein of unknown function [Mycobacterium canettii CIPT 140070017]